MCAALRYTASRARKMDNHPRHKCTSGIYFLRVRGIVDHSDAATEGCQPPTHTKTDDRLRLTPTQRTTSSKSADDCLRGHLALFEGIVDDHLTTSGTILDMPTIT